MTPDLFNPDSPEAWEALARHLSSEASDDESRAISSWLQSNEADGEMVAGLDAALTGLTAPRLLPLDADRSLAAVMSRIRSSEVVDLSARRDRTAGRSVSPSIFRQPFLRAAAVAVVAVGGAGLSWLALNRSPEPIVGQTSTYRTGAGERDSVTLSDGSKVVLGPASELIVAAAYGSGSGRREVSLRGEGHFAVVHRDERPFVVHAGNADITDIGTVFTVRTLDGDVRVSVQEGLVVLRHHSQTGDSLMLNAGDVGALRGTEVLAEAGNASPDDLAWMQGRLVFRDASFDVVGDVLKRSLGIQLQIDEDVSERNHRLNTEVTGMPPAGIGKALALAVGGVEEVRGDTVFIHSLPGRR